jgi:hypothetical protein
MPDAWENRHFFNPNWAPDGLTDADGDGHANWKEWLADTDPRDKNSRFKVGMERGKAHGKSAPFVLTWHSASGRIYSVWRSIDLKLFDPLQTNIPATPPVNVFEDHSATSGAAYFYKVEVGEQ